MSCLEYRAQTFVSPKSGRFTVWWASSRRIRPNIQRQNLGCETRGSQKTCHCYLPWFGTESQNEFPGKLQYSSDIETLDYSSFYWLNGILLPRERRSFSLHAKWVTHHQFSTYPTLWKIQLCKPQILNENYSCKPNLVGFTTETSKDLKID